MISPNYMCKIEAWAEAYDREAWAMSPEEFEALYDEAFFEAMDLEKTLVLDKDAGCVKVRYRIKL